MRRRSSLFAAVAGPRAKWLVFAVWFLVIFGASAAGIQEKYTDAQQNESTSFLPGDAESTKALLATEDLQGGELAPAVILYRRESGLTAADKQKIDAWEVAVPPTTMALAVDMLLAAATVTALVAVIPTGSNSLLARLDTKEQDYATALAARLAADLRLQAAATRVAERLDAQAAVAPVADARLVALVRGDQ